MAPQSRRLHIALTIQSLRIGGAERSTLRIARGLLERGHAVDVVLLGSTVALQHDIPRDARVFHLVPPEGSILRDRFSLKDEVGIPLLPLLKKKYLKDARSISAYIEEQRPDFVLPALPGAKISTLIAATGTSYKPAIVPIFRNHILRRSWKERQLLARLLRRADHAVAVSDGVAESLTQYLAVPRSNLTRIYNPAVLPETLRLASEKPDHPWFSDTDIPIVLGAGRLGRVKDFPTLLRAFERTARKRPVRLIIFGEGNWRSRLERLVRKLDLADSVSMPGWVTNLYSCMRRASAFLLSSRYEGLPNVLIEALSCGCPCASTDCRSGPKEILDNGRIGPLVRVGDHVALSKALDQLLDDPPCKELLMAHAERFSFCGAINCYEDLLLGLSHSSSLQSLENAKSIG